MHSIKIKKIIAYSVVLSMLLWLLSACGGNENSTSSGGDYTGGTTGQAPQGTPVRSEVSVEEMDFSYSNRDQDGTYDEDGKTDVTLNGMEITISGEGAEAADGVLTITAAGTYVISGTLTEGRIVVHAGEADKIQLVFSGISVTCSDYAPLYIRQADKVFVTLAEGTENTLTDGSVYSLTDVDANVDAVIFSREDLTINGSGTLVINAHYNHGIVSKDDLVITGGTYRIAAPGDGLQGKDCIKIADGTFTIHAGGDGIKSNNTEDVTRGYITVDGGSFQITAENDGIQAETVLRITDGSFQITTGGGSANASTDHQGNERPGWGMWGGSASSGPQNDTASAKGLKAGSLILIEAGAFVIDASDDALHSNGDAEINGGKMEIATGDDGIHGDAAVMINNGEITITKSYEGIEGANITIAGGIHSVTAADDGLNAAGGSDGSSVNGRPGQNPFSADSSYFLLISGGYLIVNASGDGLDSNGTLEVTGGTVFVSGPTNSGNGALDCNGTAKISGGIVVAAGSMGMAETFGSSSSQCSIMYNLSSVQKAGTAVTLTDSSGKVLVSYAPEKQFQNVVISTPDIQIGSTYTLYTGGSAAADGTLSGGTKAADITVSSVSVSNGGGMGGMGGMGGGPGGMGGGPGGRW